MDDLIRVSTLRYLWGLGCSEEFAEASLSHIVGLTGWLVLMLWGEATMFECFGINSESSVESCVRIVG